MADWAPVLTTLITTIGTVLTAFFARRSHAAAKRAKASAERSEAASLRPPA